MRNRKDSATDGAVRKTDVRKRAFGRDERDALVTQRRATAYGRARGKS